MRKQTLFRRLRLIALFTAGLLAMASTLQAQESAKAWIKSLQTTLQQSPAYGLSFRLSMGEEFEPMVGEITVQGESYFIRMSSNDPRLNSEVYFDGEVRTTYVAAYQEAVIESPTAGETDLLSNPANFFRLRESDYTARYLDAISWQGRSLQRIELTPTVEGAGYTAILLDIDPSTSELLRISYAIEEMAQAAELEILELTSLTKQPASTFEFDTKRHAEVEVIDFR